MKGSPQPITPRLVATATESGLVGTIPVEDPALPAGVIPLYGPDLKFETGRSAPGGKNVGKTEADLKPRMAELVNIFARGDRSGMARKLFDAFQKKRTKVTYFDDVNLTKSASMHSHIQAFCDAALNAPNGPLPPSGKVRIHQALKAANWDIAQAKLVSDLGVPAFNDGNKVLQTGDFNNGLGVMIDAVERVYVMVTKYLYEKESQEYGIELQYRFYDVFGLDDTDLARFGASAVPPSPDAFTIVTNPGAAAGMYIEQKLAAAGVGITAWWQLQHQFAYAPLVTRIILTRTYTVPAR